MERKIVLEVEELEERIAPHVTFLGGGESAVGTVYHYSGEVPPHLVLPNGNEVTIPDASTGINDDVDPLHGIKGAYLGSDRT